MMDNLYYVEYKISDTCGEMYVTDTKWGVIELGTIENGTIWEEVRFQDQSWDDFCKTAVHGGDYIITRVY